MIQNSKKLKQEEEEEEDRDSMGKGLGFNIWGTMGKNFSGNWEEGSQNMLSAHCLVRL